MTQGKEMAAKKSVYIESTIPSYATAQPSSNVLNLVRKTQTETFWNTRDAYTLWISQDVLEEIGRGDPQAARRRLDFVKDIALLPEPDGLDRLSSVISGGAWYSRADKNGLLSPGVLRFE